MDAKPIKSILFVCLGNICRSPLAQGVFEAVLLQRGLQGRLLLDSAGTGAWHAGSAPDPRSVAIAARHGIDISAQRARKTTDHDFTRFDLVLGMDRTNIEQLRAQAPAGAQDRIHLFLELANGQAHDVPDPYYGGREGFDAVYLMLREASEALVSRLAARISLPDNGHASSTM